MTVLLGFTLLYNYGMAVWEGRPQSMLRSLEIVLQTFTTVGYGEDAPWTAPEMYGVVVGMQLSSLVLIFAALPVVVLPLLEDALRPSAPTTTTRADHVVMCRNTPRQRALVTELNRENIDYVIVEPDEETALELYEQDYAVVHGDPESVTDLENVGIDTARAVVTDAEPTANASIALSVKEVNPDVRVISFVEDPDVADCHRHAGADQVLSPRQLLGESIGNKAATAVSTDLGEAIEIGDQFDVAELEIQSGSPLVGRTLAESDLGQRTGASVVGAWSHGDFRSPPPPELVLTEHTVLVVAGSSAQISRLKELTLSDTHRYRDGSVLVAGYGVAGTAVVDALEGRDTTYTVLDIEEKAGVDVVGNATDPETLREGGVTDARTAILTLADDTVTIYATLIIRELNPDIEIIVRANETENVRKLYRAGADYVLALSTVSARMLASLIVEETEVISFDTQIRVVRLSAPGLVGESLVEADVRARTGSTIIAVERDGNVLTDFDPSFVVADGDEVIVVGSDDAVDRFRAELA